MFDDRADRAAGRPWGPSGKHFGDVPWFDPRDGETVIAPEAPGTGFWAGAPSVIWDADRGTYLLTYRRRRPRGFSPDRGYVAHVAESKDGLRFADIWTVEKSAFASASMERFSLAREAGGVYRLYACYVDPADGRWRIDVLEADAPDAFETRAARPALTAASTGTEGVKDPWVFRVGGLWHMLVSFGASRDVDSATRDRMHSTGDVFNTGVLVASTGLATSPDGVRWQWEGELMGVGGPGSWDAYQARLGALLYQPPFWLGFYDGAAGVEGNYEERAGLAFSFDLRRWERASKLEPAFASPEGTGSLRYVDVVARPGALHLYYEYARAGGAHELRRSTVLR